MRVVHVIAEMAVGGAEGIVHRLARAGAADGHEVTVVSGGGSWARRLVEDGLPHVCVPDLAGARTTPRALPALRRAFADLRPDVLHSHNVRASAAAAAGCRLAGLRPAVLTTVHGLTPRSYRPAARVLRATADLVVGCAPEITARLVAAGVPARRATTVLNGAALEPASPDRLAVLRQQLGEGDAGPLVVGVGRLVPEKRWDVLVEALAGATHVRAVVAGEGSLRAQLERLAAESSAPLRFLGRVDDIPALLGLAAVYVQTSDSEGLPLALLEALSLGLPAVATAVGGVRDVVPASAARLLPAGQPAAVRSAIDELLAAPSLAGALGRAASAAASRWRPEQMVDGYRSAYLRLVGTSPGTGR